MSTRVHTTKPASHASHATQTTEAAPATAPADVATTPAAKPTGAAPAPPPLVFLDPPPPDANIPSPPADFVAGSGKEYRSLLPRNPELRALPIAVKDLNKFTNYTQILGATAPPYAQVLQALTVAYLWSSMRARSVAWDAFCESQEGIAWTTLRAQMTRLKPSFELAATGGESVETMYPGLAKLLGAKKAIAQQGAATRRLNKQAVAKGEAPLHGVVGKKRKKAAEKAAYAAAVNAPGATPAAVPAAKVPAQPQAQVAAPVVAPVANVAPVAATGGSGAGTSNGGGNGAGHP